MGLAPGSGFCDLQEEPPEPLAVPTAVTRGWRELLGVRQMGPDRSRGTPTTCFTLSQSFVNINQRDKRPALTLQERSAGLETYSECGLPVPQALTNSRAQRPSSCEDLETQKLLATGTGLVSDKLGLRSCSPLLIGL